VLTKFGSFNAENAQYGQSFLGTLILQSSINYLESWKTPFSWAVARHQVRKYGPRG